MAHSSNESLWLHSIEPMLEHHIKAYLASEYPNATLAVFMAKEITEAMQDEWLSDDSLFDEDDLDGATVQCLYCISMNYSRLKPPSFPIDDAKRCQSLL
jgi:hypothetical protein